MHLATAGSRAASPGSFGVWWGGRRGVIALALAMAALAASAAAAFGHGGGGPALEAFPSEVRAGETVSVFGEDLERLGPVGVVMLTGEGSLPVLEAETDQDGHFTASFVVPQLPERVYELVVTDAAGRPASTFLLVIAAESPAAASWLLPPIALLVAVCVGALAIGALALRGRLPTRRTVGR